MSDFHRASLEMAWLRLCRIPNESTEIENCYSGLNRELRWLWNSVYLMAGRLSGERSFTFWLLVAPIGVSALPLFKM